MADYSSLNRVGRFGMRTSAPITTFVKVDDRRSDQGPAVGRAEISEQHVAMPVSVTDGVTKIETIERVYTTSSTAYTDGFTTNGEIIENYATTEGVQGSNRSALPRGPLPHQTLNYSKAKRPIFTAEDISTNGWSGSTGGGINKSGTGDAGATDSSKPIGGGNKDVGPNQLSRPGGGITKDVTPNRLSTPSGAGAGGGAGAGTGGADSGTSRPIDGVTDVIGPNGRRGLTGGTTNGVPTNTNGSRPTDVINSTGSSNLNRPSAGTHNSGSSAWKLKTIDSNEAATKYNGIGFTERGPQRKKVIDSREAAEKYNGFTERGPQRKKVIDSREAAEKYNGVIISMK